VTIPHPPELSASEGSTPGTTGGGVVGAGCTEDANVVGAGGTDIVGAGGIDDTSAGWERRYPSIGCAHLGDVRC
jgi:hypothetical protein